MFYDSVVLTFFSCLAHKIRLHLWQPLFSIESFSLFVFPFSYNLRHFPFHISQLFSSFLSSGLEMQMNNDESVWASYWIVRLIFVLEDNNLRWWFVMLEKQCRDLRFSERFSSKCPVYPGCFLRRKTRPFHSSNIPIESWEDKRIS